MIFAAKKIAFLVFFLYFTGKKTSQIILSVAGSVPLHSQHLLDPPGHRIAQLLEVVPGQALHPEHLDGGDELVHGAGVLVLQVLLQIIPAIFNRIQVGAVARPINNLKGFVLQEALDSLTRMARCAVLEEVRCPVDLHEGKEVILQHFLVSFRVHRGVSW